MEQRTAEAWVQFFALSFIITGITSAFIAVMNIFTSPLAPAGELGRAGTIFATVFGSVFSLGFAFLYLLMGAGLWWRRDWSRITMLIFAWIGVAFGALLLLGGGILGPILNSVPEMGALGGLLGGLFAAIGLLILAISVFQVWFFTRPEVVALFNKDTGSLMPSFEGKRESTVRAWSIYVWSVAITVALVGAVIALAAPALFSFIEEAAQKAASDAPAIPAAVVQYAVIAGIALMVFGALLGFIAAGLWQLQSWARTATIVLAYLGCALVAAVIAFGFTAGLETYDLVSGAAQLLSYAIIGGLQIWFFTQEETKAVFRGPLDSRR